MIERLAACWKLLVWHQDTATKKKIKTNHLTLFLILYFCLRLVRPDFPFFFTMAAVEGGHWSSRAKPAISKGCVAHNRTQPAAVFGDSNGQGAPVARL